MSDLTVSRPKQTITQFLWEGLPQRSKGVGGSTYETLFANQRPARTISAQRIGTIAIDAEEDFDWKRPVPGTPFTTACMRNLGDIQTIAAAYGARPTYLLTDPVLLDPDAVRSLRRYAERGECALGLQLHAWVTPPFEGAGSIRESFSGNLSPALEERKLLASKGRFVSCFGFEPTVFRSGRYGLGAATAALLEAHGFEVDTSVAPRTDFTAKGGPDFTAFDCAPFWFGERRALLELPLCRSIVGWGGAPARAGYQALAHRSGPVQRLVSLLTRSRAAERITLSPEGNTLPEMRRLVRWLLARGDSVLPLSFHSSSLVSGLNPYVCSKADLHAFYDRLSATLAFLADDVGCRFASLPELPTLMHPALAHPATTQ